MHFLIPASESWCGQQLTFSARNSVSQIWFFHLAWLWLKQWSEFKFLLSAGNSYCTTTIHNFWRVMLHIKHALKVCCLGHHSYFHCGLWFCQCLFYMLLTVSGINLILSSGWINLYSNSFFNCLTNCMDLCPPWEAASCSATQQFPQIL